MSFLNMFNVSTSENVTGEVELDPDELSMANLYKELKKMKDNLNEVILNNRSLKNKISELTAENDHIYDKLYNIETKVNGIDQYSRRNNIEISNIPEKIVQNKLEVYVLKFLSDIDVNLESYDLVAVHRLGKYTVGKNRVVIVRFVNRKDAYHCLRVSKNIKKSKNKEFKRFYINENLCPENKKIFNFLFKLMKMDKIKKVWSYNGSVFYQLLDSDEDYYERANHFDDLDFMFDEFNLNDSES